MPENDRIHDVCHNYYRDDIYKYERFVDWFKDNFRSEEEKVLAAWKKDLDEREYFYHSLPWDSENVKTKEEMLSKKTKFWDEYFKMVQKVNQQIDEKGNWGDYEESMSEKLMFEGDGAD
jgi:hypothetical protein